MSDTPIAAPLAGSLEENVLTALCWSDHLAPRLALRLTTDLFSTAWYRQIATKAFNHVRMYGKAPAAHLRDLMEPELRRGDYGRLVDQALDALQQLAPHLQPDFVIDQLENFAAIATLRAAVHEADEALSKDDLSTAQRALYEQPHIVPPAPGIWISDADRMLSFLDKSDDEQFSCGIEELDRRGVRPARGTQFVFIAPPKRGKTWFLVGIGKAGIKYRKKVLHITLENSAKLTAQRYCQALFGMTADKAQVVHNTYFARDDAGRFTGFDEVDIDAEAIDDSTRDVVHAKLTRKRRRKLLIQEFPTGTLTVGQLIAYLDMLKQYEGFEPDMLIIDYPDLMYVEGGRDNYRLALSRLFQQLRGLCVARNMAEIIVTQGNRQSATAKRVSGTHVAEDFSKIGTADTIITYSQTDRERERGLARIGVYGARNARDHYMVMITQSYDTGQFCLDSTYFGKYAEEELNRVTGNKDDEDKD